MGRTASATQQTEATTNMEALEFLAQSKGAAGVRSFLQGRLRLLPVCTDTPASTAAAAASQLCSPALACLPIRSPIGSARGLRPTGRARAATGSDWQQCEQPTIAVGHPARAVAAARTARVVERRRQRVCDYRALDPRASPCARVPGQRSVSRPVLSIGRGLCGVGADGGSRERR